MKRSDIAGADELAGKLAARIGSNLLTLKNERQNTIYWDRLVNELAAEIVHLNDEVKDWVSGSERPTMKDTMVSGKTSMTEKELLIDGQQVMQDWQVELMRAVAGASSPSNRTLLEIGYGLGIAARFVQQHKPAQHTIIECNPTVYEEMVKWAEPLGIHTIEGTWQEELPKLGKYDSILFDPYPFDETQFNENWLKDGNFAAHFFSHVADHLNEGGVFTYFSNEIDSLSRHHQRKLLEHFSRVEIRIVKGLQPPADCQYWWAPTMIVVKATK